MRHQQSNITYHLSFILVIITICIFTNCSKEPLDIRNVDFSKLESSYYKLSQKSVEISLFDLEGLLLSKSDNSISFSSSELIDQIEVGTIIVSSLDTPREDYLCRRVVNKQEVGTTITFDTESATIIQAYESFYFNSEKTNLVQVRESYSIVPLYKLVGKKMSEGFTALAEKVSSNISAEIELGISGDLAYELLHPNDVYAYLYPNTISIDEDENGIWDFVESDFGTDGVDTSVLETLGFYKFSLKGFGLNTMSLKLSLGAGVSASDLDENFDVFSSIDISDLDATNVLNPVNEINLYHVPPATTIGAVSIFLTAGPLIEATGNMSLFTGIDITADDKIDIEFGHGVFYDLVDGGLPDIAKIAFPDLKIFKNGAEFSGTNPFGDIKVEGVIGGSGNATLNLGANIGVSAGAGEATTSGVAAGFVFPAGIQATLNSTGIAKMTLFPFDLSTAKYNGSICGDISFGILDLQTFLDVNVLGTSIDDYLDVIIKLSDLTSNVPDFKTSLLQLAPDYSPGEGICFNASSCDNMKIVTLNLTVNGSFDNISIESYAQFPSDVEYTISIVSDAATFEVDATYLTNTPETVDFVLTGDEISNLAAVLANKYTIKINVADIQCDYIDLITQINIVSAACESIFFESTLPDSDDIYTYKNLVDQKVSYFKYDESQVYPSVADVEAELETITNCYNNSGLFIEAAGEPLPYLVNEYESYVFVNDGGIIKLLSFNPVSGSQEFDIQIVDLETFGTSVFAPILK